MQSVDSVKRQHCRFIICFRQETFPGDQCSTKSTHDTGDIGTDRFASGDKFETSQDSIIIKSTALHYDLFSQFRSIGYFDHFKQSIFNDRISQSGGNICHFRPLFLGLFHLGIHKYGTACTEIDGMLGKQSRGSEVFYTVIQGLCKSLNERTTTGRTCLIELYAVHSLILDFNTFHILAADIQNTVHRRFEKCCCIVMSNRFYFSFVQHKCCFNQGFSVTSRTGMGNPGILRQQGIDFLHGTDGGSQRTSVIITVKGVEQRTVLSNKSDFGCGRTSVNAKIAFSFVFGKFRSSYTMTGMSFLKCCIILFVLK